MEAHAAQGKNLRSSASKFVVTALLIISVAASADDLLWLEREWISDPDSTMVANPQLLRADDLTRAKFKAMFGKMLWRFSEGVFQFKLPGVSEGSSPYFVRPVDDERLEVVLDFDRHQANHTIWRTAEGFCTRADPEWMPAMEEFEAWKESFIVECFKPIDGF